MKKAMKKGCLIMILLCALLAFAGCSEEEDPSAQPVDKETVAGSWIIDGSASFGIEGSLVLDEDNSVELVVGGSSYVGTWAVEDGNVTITIEGQEKVPASYSGDKLTVGDDGASKLVFVRGEGAEGEAEGEAESPAESEGPNGVGEEQPAAPEPGEADEEGDEGDYAEPELVDEVITDVGPVVIADDENCTITVTGRGTDFTADPCYRLVFTNKTASPLYITAEEDFDVNGKTVMGGIDDIADPGETIETEMYFPTDELGGGLDQLVNVNGTLNVQIDETYEPVANYPFHMD